MTCTTSLKYHRLHPEYVHNRIERLRGMYLLRVLLLICDIVSRNGSAGSRYLADIQT